MASFSIWSKGQRVSASHTFLGALFPCFSALRSLPKGFTADREAGKTHDIFAYDADSNGPHEHEHHAPKGPIAYFLTSTPKGKWGSRSDLAAPPPSFLTLRSLNFSNRRFASKFTVTDSRDAIFDSPDFTPVARKVCDPDANRAFSYFMVGATGVLGAMAGKSTVMNFLASWSASSEALAMAQVEVDLSAIPEGKSVIIKWRGKPIFIRHRTPSEIDEAASVDVAALRDPQLDAERTQKPEWIVMLGICTHLGCVPLANSGDYNGCGSHYDISGRIRKGPAPTNLEIPEYKFLEEERILIG